MVCIKVDSMLAQKRRPRPSLDQRVGSLLAAAYEDDSHHRSQVTWNNVLLIRLATSSHANEVRVPNVMCPFKTSDIKDFMIGRIVHAGVLLGEM